MGLMKRADGHLVRLADGHLAKASVGCADADSGPCYELSGYVDGDLVACAACRASTNAAWDGEYDFHSGSNCFWKIITAIPFTDDPKINGKLLATNPQDSGGTRVSFTPSGALSNPCKWRLQVGCVNEPGLGLSNIWRGFKTIGFDPTGTYTRDAGCDATATLTVVAC